VGINLQYMQATEFGAWKYKDWNHVQRWEGCYFWIVRNNAL